MALDRNGESNATMGRTHAMRKGFTFRYKSTRMLIQVTASSNDRLFNGYLWFNRFHGSCLCCCRLRSCTTLRLTGCEKSKISSKLSSVLPFWTKNMTTQDLLVLLVSFGTACFALNIYKLNQEPQQ